MADDALARAAETYLHIQLSSSHEANIARIASALTDAVAQAVKERDEWQEKAEGQETMALREMRRANQAESERDRNAEEIAQLKREIKSLLYGGRGNG